MKITLFSLIMALVTIIVVITFPPTPRHYTLTVLWGYFTYQMSLKRNRQECRLAAFYVLVTLIAGLTFSIITGRRGIMLDSPFFPVIIMRFCMFFAIAIFMTMKQQRALTLSSGALMVLSSIRANHGLTGHIYALPAYDAIGLLLLEVSYTVMFRIAVLPEDNTPHHGRKRKVKQTKRRHVRGRIRPA